MNQYDFPLLKNLMGAYLNQDFDYICEADTIEDAMDYYVQEAGCLAKILSEIETFLSRYPTNTDKIFEDMFHPEIIIDDVKLFLLLLKDKITSQMI
ncbi:contact-dependent growth inhibition system immunity protein [Enterobacteriaceae bacterium LUAb1]